MSPGRGGRAARPDTGTTARPGSGHPTPADRPQPRRRGGRGRRPPGSGGAATAGTTRRGIGGEAADGAAQRAGGPRRRDGAAQRAETAGRRCGHCGENTVAGRVQIFLKRGPEFGCRRCSIQRRDAPRSGRSLEEVRPRLAAEFHAGLNAPLTASDLTPGSQRKVYWHCVSDPAHPPHLQCVSNRRKSGCPACVNRVVTQANNLLAVAPQVAAQWHPSKNGSLTAEAVVAGSNRRVW
ncbi:zinc-ribbon domain-containing protein [Streptomyces lavendofoliae]|uniref:zinc-ribbon domain-containing protein n=1 Tax=Streptomyces lavendofoliae TaxID=67314 RepID=UPI003D8DBD58